MDPRRDPRLTVHEPRSPLRWLRDRAGRAPWPRIAIALAALIPAGFGYALDWFDRGWEPELGLVTLSPEGDVLFTEWPELFAGYRTWVQEGRRADGARCLAVPDRQRERLRDEAPGGRILAYSFVEIGAREAGASCGGRGRWEAKIKWDTLGWVRCGTDAFVANGLACPGTAKALEVVRGPAGNDLYPRAAIMNGQEGEARVRVTRDETGTPTGCTVLESSGHSALDAQTCRLVGTDPLFTPAPMRQRARIAEPIEQRVRWVLPSEPRP